MTDLVESTRQYLNEDPDDGEQEILNEFISLRTGLIGAGLAKTKQYANQIDGQVRTLKGDAGRLKTSKTPEDANKTLADAHAGAVQLRLEDIDELAVQPFDHSGQLEIGPNLRSMLCRMLSSL